MVQNYFNCLHKDPQISLICVSSNKPNMSIGTLPMYICVPVVCIIFPVFNLLKMILSFSDLSVPRALKTRGNTPKYGLIFHSTYIGRAGAKNKGRISRYLANKCSIASRIDCFGGRCSIQILPVCLPNEDLYVYQIRTCMGIYLGLCYILLHVCMVVQWYKGMANQLVWLQFN